MAVTFLWYPRCSTAQKAKKWLEDNRIDFEMRDMIKNNPSREELSAWQARSGLPLKKFFNTSGQKYRGLQLKDRLNNLSNEEMLELLSTDGMLVKRPIILAGNEVLIGFKHQEWAEKLGSYKEQSCL